MISNYENIFVVGKKKGEWDFSIRATIQDLSIDDMNELRAMIMAAIGTAEDMWRRRPETSGLAVKKETEDNAMKKIRGEVLDNIDSR